VTSTLGQSSISAPDAGEARTYRQHVLAGRRPIRVILVLEIAWFVAGPIVLRQLTLPGSDRLARTIVGLVIWIGPLAALAVPLLVGGRGRFHAWWWPRMIVRVDDDGLAWWSEGSVRRLEDSIAWSAVASVHPTFPTGNRPPGADCALAAPDGQVLARLPCRLVRIDRPVSRVNRWRRVAWLPDIAVAVRPDRYRRRRVLGRRATLRDPAADLRA
jgi:hypothetical protein